MKSYRIIGLLLLLCAICVATPTYSFQDTKVNVSLLTSIPDTKAHATIYSTQGTEIQSLVIPNTIDLPPGRYSVRFELAGYQNETKSFDVSNSDLNIEFQLKEDRNWQQLIDLEDRYHRFVEFQETGGEFLALIDTVQREKLETYLSDQADIDITHYIYSPNSQVLRTVEMFDEFSSVMQTASKLDERYNWRYSDLSYSIVSPSLNFAIIPFREDEDQKYQFQLLDLTNDISIVIDIFSYEPFIPWNGKSIFWSQDESQVILNCVMKGFDSCESYLLSISKNPLTVAITPISTMVDKILQTVSVTVLTANPDLGQILLLVTNVNSDNTLDYTYVVLNQRTPIPLPMSFAFGFSWLDSGNLAFVNSSGLIELNLASLQEETLIPADQFPVATIENVLISPDLSYMLVQVQEEYDGAIYAVDLGFLH